MHGKGIQTWSDGRCYDGEFVDGKKSGNGELTCKNGTKYVGEWKNGKQHGRGYFYKGDEGEGNEKPRYGRWEYGKRVEWIDEE